MISLNIFLSSILPTPPAGTPWEAASALILTMALWLGRAGGLIAWAGAIKFVLAFKDDDAREQTLWVSTMISGFMIQMAANDNTILKGSPNSYSQQVLDIQFDNIMKFAQAWVGRGGGIIAFIGATIFFLAMRDPDNMTGKIVGIKTMATGFMAASVALMLPLFV